MTDDDHILISAFRYCLGRQTYIVSHCCHWLKERWEKISPEARTLIQEELGKAIKNDERWRRTHHPNNNRSSGFLGSEEIDAPLWRDLHAWMNHG